VGERYLKPINIKRRTLLLGESNYTEPEKFTSELVINCVKNDLSEGQFGVERDTTGFCRFSTKIRRIVFGPNEQFHPSEFWHDVAFYNFVQSLVGHRARERPTSEMWHSSTFAFEEVVDTLKPERILVLGKANWLNLLSNFSHTLDSPCSGRLELKNGGVKVGYVNHPSSSLSYAKWNPIAEAFLQS
jgi:hypothetical protein